MLKGSGTKQRLGGRLSSVLFKKLMAVNNYQLGATP